jgi:hypothetical protein
MDRSADDHPFERLGTDIAKRGEIGTDPGVIYRTVIARALLARRNVRSVKDGRDPNMGASKKQHAEDA